MNNVMSDEVWKVIDGYENYMVSNLGRVKNCNRNKIMSTHLDHKGYLCTSLALAGVTHTKNIHRLVALYFVPNPLGKPQVNHIDEDKTNPAYYNLEWMTCQENIEYSIKVTYAFTDPSGQFTEVRNLSKFCRERGLTRANMQKVHSGERETHKGWRKHVPINV